MDSRPRQFAEGEEKDEPIVVIVIGGDGTTHELIEGVTVDYQAGNEEQGWGRWELIVLPFGTANALYYSLFPPADPLPDTSILSSLPYRPSPEVTAQILPLISFLTRSSSPLPLPITLTTLLPPPSPRHGELPETSRNIKPIPTHVVLSTSLHAAILESSEKLRETHPGNERFRIAAQESMAIFFDATARLFASDSKVGGGRRVELGVKQWDPRVGSWVNPFTEHRVIVDEDGKGKSGIELQGPFAYFTSTATVSRFEPAFVISPLTSLRPSPSSEQRHQNSDRDASKENKNEYIYIIILRPLRDPYVLSASSAISQSEQPGRPGIAGRGERWAKRAQEVLGKAYHDGAHIDVTYPFYAMEKEGNASGEGEEEGEESWEAEVKGRGEPVVELYRCAAFSWEPIATTQTNRTNGEGNERARLVCADGALHWIPEGGKAEVGLMVPSGKGGFYVWA
ncbi:hypothetical protein I307_05922 [Cryptococcus deuterogattii 99/473]|uniref:DAGKc domain-containing protein n=1 Tax=Cryptococcus deuterogattii Ram5 TaxID=1296110 RepID=A0A0D0T3A5_9TREE|nr:hypothetical protein I313_03554 [Cryptococcus deuterogattii Ram5]KIY54736.1 hypothetical protein I307_05922 [Cryptococcus deuterogattii 99/473]